ncbi:hypothetical protein AWI06_21920 [Enterobacter hormaechei subsp. xiangfangensis]|uniref:hypothetical protein n=1 Tax=Enterobacter hormaechei TaxID=158836 RepID=UPI0007502CF5|nr:hypothetical protein [Enterobacter hormaechei]KUP98902.1 hypothetical protein AWI06_21920 [Enterobacter hormaechei subsp. xiangfangensis]MBT1773458.1 hypothetical protein [Enterobacter hormaechei subsp. xiangfangensis]MDN4964897.1 hypothetical protein [Enterobacter hormaechei]MDO6155178.1 hypothetical protein [Enterobacter hormaechei]
MKKIAILSLKVFALFAVITWIVGETSDNDTAWMLPALLTFIAILPAIWVGALITITESINFVKGGIKK